MLHFFSRNCDKFEGISLKKFKPESPQLELMLQVMFKMIIGHSFPLSLLTSTSPGHTIVCHDTARTNRLLLRDGHGSKRLNEERLWKGEALWSREGGGEGGEEKWYEMEGRRGGIAGRWCHVFRLIAKSGEAISKIQATYKHTTTH